MATRCLVLCFLFTAAVAIGWAAEPVAFDERAGYNSQRAVNKVLWIKIELHQDNRMLAVECDSGDYYRYSDKQLEGEQKPSRIPFGFDFPSGEYQCIATLVRITDGKHKEFFARTSFIIF